MVRRRAEPRHDDSERRPGAIPAEWVDRAGALYLEGVRARAPLDRVVAGFLRAHKALDDRARAFVVDTAHAMWRSRFRLEAAVAHLPFEPARGALAALFLAGARGVDASSLPLDRRGVGTLVDAWRRTADAPLAVRASLPPWLVDELVRARPGDGEALCLSFAEAPPQTLRANALKATRDEVIDALAAEGIVSRAGSAPEAIVVAERSNVFRTRAFGDGLFEVQDEGSQRVGLVCRVAPGMLVVDACAGAGGKTLHLAALMDGRGVLHAFDAAAHRLEALRERAARAGAHNVRVHDDLRDKKRLRGEADVVLVDAPCSGTGVLRRNPDTSWRLSRDDVARLVVQQGEILDECAPLVKPGGGLVYATCSILDDENRAVVDAFLARTPGFTRANELALDPLVHGTDGFYACALARSG